MGPRDIERLGRFEIVRKLASGGMGTVWLACLSGEAGFRRLVALKRLHAHLADEPDFVHMFFDEARLAARIHHPNVVPILEIGKEGSERYLVMEYIEGTTLEQLATKRRERLAPGIGVRVVLDALAGLQAAHDLEDDAGQPLDLVHRDVSPQNILVGLDGLARLTDFGIARARTRVARETQSGQFKGKLTYSAPEQVLARPVDRRTDVYAMGIVLWEALTGARLFDGEVEAEVFEKLLHKPIPAPESVRADLPAELGALVLRALRREPEQRFASASEFADALENVAKKTGLLATHREVAAFVARSSGDRLSERRDQVRDWLSQRDATAAALPVAGDAPVQTVGPITVRPANVAPPPDAASGPIVPAVTPPTTSAPPNALPYHWAVHESAPARRRAWPWITGVALALAIGVAAVSIVRRARPVAAAAPPAASMPPLPSPDPPRADPPLASAPPPAAPAPSAPPTASARPAWRPASRPTATGKNAEFGDRW